MTIPPFLSFDIIPAAVSAINAKELPALGLQRTLGMPPGGPKCIPIRLDFVTSATWNLDYSNEMNLGKLDMVQTLWVDNFGNGQILKITVPGSQQVLQIPAGIQGYFPVLCPNPVRITFESTGATVQQVTLINFPVFA
jgi:hypothetical protein